MSFLNPIQLPIKQYSSTDTDAPQIDYNNRVVGDVKTIFKGCLVTGYGEKEAAGWTTTDETDDTIKLKSPSVEMNDYELVLTDEAVSFTWECNYLDEVLDLKDNRIYKAAPYHDKNHESNGWRLLVTDCGLFFIELFRHNRINQTLCRLTYLGKSKTTLENDSGKNFVFWCTGVASPHNYFYEVFDNNKFYFALGDLTSGIKFQNALIEPFRYKSSDRLLATIEVWAPVYMDYRGCIISVHPGVLMGLPNTRDNLYGCYEREVNGRPVLYVCTSFEATTSEAAIEAGSAYFAIYLDYWDY